MSATTQADSVRQLWAVVDSRTGARASVASYYTREQAQRSIDDTRRLVASGGRPDLLDVVDHLSAAVKA
jgi:hypothetical protein